VVEVTKTRQTPPLPQGFATHAPPVQVSVASQTSQVPPATPQAASVVPVAQDPSPAQHPPGQGFATEQTVQTSLAQMGALAGHDATHTPLLALQQVLAGQSPGLAEHAAHWPLTHTGSLPAQSSLSQHSWHSPAQHISPLPHAVPSATVVQKPPLHASHTPHCVLSQHSWQEPAQHTLPPPQVLPFASVVHVPTDPVRLQAWQTPSQTLSQQTSSTQCPEAHCPSWVQASPFG
jgi:hypothetical protein